MYYKNNIHSKIFRTNEIQNENEDEEYMIKNENKYE